MTNSNIETEKSPAYYEQLSRAFGAVKGKTVDLFVYGTLMNDHYVNLLLNRNVETAPAKLHNYMRIAPPWSFPFIVRQYGAMTYGRILKNITREELKILDDFESEGIMYKRQVVVVRTKNSRQRCMTYVGNISALQHSFGKEVKFEDRYSLFIQKKIDSVIKEISPDKSDMTARVMHELSSSAVDEIIQSHFDGNYICNYIMIQALEEAKPPTLATVLANKELLPYAANYMRLACQHIVFNQIVEGIRREYPEAVRISQNYFRHGLAILLAFIYYNRHSAEIHRLFEEYGLGTILDGKSYTDYAKCAIDISDKIFSAKKMEDIIDYVEDNWYSTPTPLGAELEFSYLGKRAVDAKPGEDKIFDAFYWFKDFDMYHRTWRLGGHVDSHREMSTSQERHRGFFEYALGRYNIVGDLSRPLFDCPWGMSLLINEAVQFLDVIQPHSLHISLDLPRNQRSYITYRPHVPEDLACLVMLGGDIRPDSSGILRDIRIYEGELDTNTSKSLNFSDRKYHFSKYDQDPENASEVMEYKFMRLHKRRTDYEGLIIALKGYQFASQGRPIKNQFPDKKELPEQIFLRSWAENPQPLDTLSIRKFLEKVEKGIILENNIKKLDHIKKAAMERIEEELLNKNKMLSEYEK